MLNMLPTDNKKLLDELSFAIFMKPYNGTIGYVFYSDDTVVGFAKITVDRVSVIEKVGVLPAYRGNGYGDFFTRSLLFRLMQISNKVRIGYVSGYYNKFGFVKVGENMEVDSVNLKFDSACGHC